VRYAWIEGQRGSFALEAMCKVLGVSPSGLAGWKGGGGCSKRLSDAQLLTLIRTIHAESKAAYGSPRIWREIKARGLPVGRERVARLMKEHDIRAKHKRRYKATTDSKHALPVAANVLDQRFETSRPDQTWTADITFIPTGEGWLYLAVVMDLYTRMIVGWSMDARMTRELVISALCAWRIFVAGQPRG
jgi:putative transposase